MQSSPLKMPALGENACAWCSGGFNSAVLASRFRAREAMDAALAFAVCFCLSKIFFNSLASELDSGSDSDSDPDETHKSLKTMKC